MSYDGTHTALVGPDAVDFLPPAADILSGAFAPETEAAAFSPTEPSLARAHPLAVWDVGESPPRLKWQARTEGAHPFLTFSGDGQRLALATASRINVYDAAKGTLVSTVRMPSRHGAVLLSFTGSQLATEVFGEPLAVWDLERTPVLRVPVRDLDVLRTGTPITFVRDDNRLLVWEDHKIWSWDFSLGTTIALGRSDAVSAAGPDFRLWNQVPAWRRPSDLSLILGGMVLQSSQGSVRVEDLRTRHGLADVWPLPGVNTMAVVSATGEYDLLGESSVLADERLRCCVGHLYAFPLAVCEASKRARSVVALSPRAVGMPLGNRP